MSRDAINNPVMGARKEFHSSDVQPQQRAIIGEKTTLATLDNSIETIEGPDHKERLDALAFMEEPVCIRIEMGREKNPAKVVQCWVQGIGAEVFRDGKWHQLGYLPIGREIITRRKYVEVLAAARNDTVDTLAPVVEEFRDDFFPENKVQIHTTQLYPFSVIEDRNPKGAAWLTQLLNSRR